MLSGIYYQHRSNIAIVPPFSLIRIVCMLRTEPKHRVIHLLIYYDPSKKKDERKEDHWSNAIYSIYIAEFSTKWKAEARTWNPTGRYPRPIQRGRNLRGLSNSNPRRNNPNNPSSNSVNSSSNSNRSNNNNSSNSKRAAFHHRPKISISSNCLPATATPALRTQRIYGTIRHGSGHHRTMPSRFN